MAEKMQRPLHGHPTRGGFTSVRPPPARAVRDDLGTRLMSDESASEQVAGTITKTLGRHAVSAVYLNTPTIELRDASRIHYGSLILAIHGTPPRTMTGDGRSESPQESCRL